LVVFIQLRRRVLAKGSSTQLLELKALVVKPISQPLQISTKSIWRIFGIILELYNDIIKHIGQHKKLFKKKYFKISRNKKLWNFPMLRINQINII
jgi:hypothetical protein